MIRKRDDMTREVRESMRGGDGKVSILHYFNKQDFTAGVRLCAKLTIRPGASIGAHRHEKEDEVYIITRGSGVLDDGATQTRVHVGDAVLTGKGESHAIRNDGAEDLVLTAFIACYAD
jgi:mannose-6-phosphate isomerase-like protein (cupin superfamily)